jgi:pyrroline-5-carboxylate reductase
MGPFYYMLKNVRDFVASQGVDPATASKFVGGTYLGIAKDAHGKCGDPAGFDELIAEQTPGGLNEQLIGHIDQAGVGEAYKSAIYAAIDMLETFKLCCS